MKTITIVFIQPKDNKSIISNEEFKNEILAQSVRHEIYLQTKNIRELMLARAVATSVVAPKDEDLGSDRKTVQEFSEDAILKDWFETNG